MSSSKRRQSQRYRPEREALEGRQLLSTVFRGTDVDGDAWTLSLVGPGSFQVVNQPDPATGIPTPIGQPALIDSITVQGSNPSRTRLIGVVSQSATGDGRVFFSELQEISSAISVNNVGSGLLAVDMPQFWLGDTDPTGTDPVRGLINIPDGVVTLRFGGVDTTAFGDDTNGMSDQFTINLGQPLRIGTSIIVDGLITANEAGDGTIPDTQDTVDITVLGRLNVFQANSIEGDETLALGDLGRFTGDNVGGTTIVVNDPDGFAGPSTGAIGRFRIGGDATNLTVTVNGSDPRITSFFIGGETNKVTIEAPSVVRNAEFGLGMDTVSILTGNIESLEANRGAVASTVVATEIIQRGTFGADVLDTVVLAGYTGTIDTPVAQAGGQMTVQIAGNVFDSVFAASVNPIDGIFGDTNDLVIPQGYINAKVEGLIVNFNPIVSPTATDRAFFAQTVRLESGPVVPPAVLNQPFIPIPASPGRTPGVLGISGGTQSPSFRFLKRRNNREVASGFPRL